jgi:hypothetical protein
LVVKKLGLLPITAKYSLCVTSYFPIRNPLLIVTNVCGPSSLSRSTSFVGLPILNVPGGMNTMFVGATASTAR